MALAWLLARGPLPERLLGELGWGSHTSHPQGPGRLLLRADWALARQGVSRDVTCSALKGEMVPDSLPATPKSSPTGRVPSRGTPRIPAPLHLSPFSPPDRDRRGDSPAWSGRGVAPPASPIPREPSCYPAAWMHKYESGLTPRGLFQGPYLATKEPRWGTSKLNFKTSCCQTMQYGQTDLDGAAPRLG